MAIANAPGAGVADDKVLYSYVPELIRYYLGEEPQIANVDTWRCLDDGHRSHVLGEPRHARLQAGQRVRRQGRDHRIDGDQSTNLTQLRRADRGTTLGTGSPSRSLRCRLPPRSAGRVSAASRRPASVHPVGPDPYVSVGGLTRVALREGSLVVNSSQGGGSKDTWIVDHRSARRLTPRPAMTTLTPGCQHVKHHRHCCCLAPPKRRTGPGAISSGPREPPG